MPLFPFYSYVSDYILELFLGFPQLHISVEHYKYEEKESRYYEKVQGPYNPERGKERIQYLRENSQDDKSSPENEPKAILFYCEFFSFVLQKIIVNHEESE